MMLVKNQKDYNKAKWVAGIWTLIAYAGAVLIGFIGIAFIHGGMIDSGSASLLTDNANKGYEMIFPVLVNMFMLPAVAGFLLSGSISAMMSTASSEIILTSSAITEDIYGNYSKKRMSQKKALWFNRIITLIVGLAAFFLAISANESIFGLVSYAWSGIGSSFGPALLLLLFWKKFSRAGVIASLLSGTLSTIIWKNLFEQDTGVSERLASFVFAMFMAVLFSYLIPEKNKK